MKKLVAIRILILSLVALNTSSCLSQDVNLDFSKINKEGFTNLKAPLVLAEFNSVEELYRKAPEAVNLLVNESIQYNKENSKVSSVVTQLSIVKNQVIISKIYFLNEEAKQLVQGFYFDANSNSYLPIQTNDWSDALFGASCPSGMSEIKSCGNFGGTSDCVGGAIRDFLTKAIKSVGDCANVQVHVGALSTRICGGGC
jgi:hypothetical protein